MRPVQVFPNFQTTNLSFTIFIVSVDKIMPKILWMRMVFTRLFYGVISYVKVVFPTLCQPVKAKSFIFHSYLIIKICEFIDQVV